MVVIDANMLMLLVRPDIVPAAAPGALIIDHPKERIEFLVRELEKAKAKIVIPTPALSESLVRADAAAAQQIIEQINKFSVFRIEPFDTRAAIEVALMTRNAIDSGGKKLGSAATWAKLKYDRQIVAIAKVCGATTIYSDDRDIRIQAVGYRSSRACRFAGAGTIKAAWIAVL
jgi:predicted nucleic acid-binding protein